MTWCSPRRRPSASSENRGVTKLFGIPVDDLAVVLAVLSMAAFAAVGMLALRNRVFFRMGVRNIRRRPGRSALIVVGSMLGTTIIAAALATGTRWGGRFGVRPFRPSGRPTRWSPRRGDDRSRCRHRGTTGTRYFPESYAERIAASTRGSDLVDGVAPVIVETIAVQDLTTRQNEPRTTLFAGDPESLRPFGDITSDGKTVSLADLTTGEVYLNADAADELGARAGDSLASRRATLHHRDRKSDRPLRRRGDGRFRSTPPALAGSAPARQARAREGVFVSNTGDAESGAKLSGQVIDRMQPTLSQLGLEADNTRKTR